MKSSVLKSQTSKYRNPLHNQSLRGSPRASGILILRQGVASSIAGSSKDSYAIDDYLPSCRNANFTAAENGDNFNHNLVSLKIGLGQIDLKAAKDRHDFSAHEILGNDAAPTAPKHVDVIEPRL